MICLRWRADEAIISSAYDVVGEVLKFKTNEDRNQEIEALGSL